MACENRVGNTKNWMVLGGSGGLGAAFVRYLLEQEENSHITVLSRGRVNEIEDLLGCERLDFIATDFTQSDEQEKTLHHLMTLNPSHIGYFPGGGPFGRYEDKSWASHEWAWELSFKFPAKLLHYVLRHLKTGQLNLVQIFFIGSSIAESKPDPGAGSYCAAKHALRGLVASVIEENARTAAKVLDLQLFSPGYMDTKLLSPNAKPRLDSAITVADVADVVKALYGQLEP